MPHHVPAKAVAVSALSIAALALAGCAQLSDIAHGKSTTHVDTRAALKAPPEWLPSDASDITVVTGTNGGDTSTPPTTVLFTSAEGVVSDRCADVERNSAPTMTLDEPDAPEEYTAETVTRCGAWSMVAKGDRWLAWTPNTADGE